MTFRNAVFQLHWFFGITAGIVLALVGVTGAMLSFEDDLLEALNPGVMTVEPRGERLSPQALVERVQAQRAGAAIASLERSSAPAAPAVVGFAPPEGERRGERRNVDPYTGELLPKPRYEGFFRTTMQLHRWLVMDDVGKQIVGASTVILIFFCLSGLYLRWPRRWGSLRTWLALDWRQKGRNFLWHLHSIVGTWVLLAYLVMSLTGLWWSYDWYRDAVNRWAESGAPVEAPVQPAADRGTPPSLDIDAAWDAFEASAPDWSTATLGWPKDGGPVEFRYLDAKPAHERARNTLELDPWTLEAVAHERYDDRGWRQKIGGSMFALHRGSFFGTGGVVVFMLASLLMPLFAITGWMLYLQRRRSTRAAHALARDVQAALPATVAGVGDPVLVVHASQTGTAEGYAWKTAAALREGGLAADVRALGTLAPEDLAAHARMLFVVSTFGDGEAPDGARAFARRLRGFDGRLDGLRYGVLAFGDASYGAHYCGFGRELDQRLQHAGAHPLFDRVEVDAGDAAALRHWQHHIGHLSGVTGLPDWQPPEYGRWRLAERRLLNPGSPGGPAFHIALVPEAPTDLQWEAGDIAEVGPRHSAEAVEAWLAATGLDGTTAVTVDGTTGPLADVLARSHLPDPRASCGASVQSLVASLAPLPHREYSIASLPADGSLQLLVRRMARPDGEPGLGSGWLTAGAAIGDCIDVRVRRNPGFHPPTSDVPLLLIGNGTGLAGLRAVLKSRVAQGRHRNWLLFGERTAAHDAFHGVELETWLREGRLQRLERVFSRDQPTRRYVQHAVADAADDVRRWIEAGAAVYVCGSLAGMAPAVDDALASIIGRDALEAMAAEGRYRRDVY